MPKEQQELPSKSRLDLNLSDPSFTPFDWKWGMARFIKPAPVNMLYGHREIVEAVAAVIEAGADVRCELYRETPGTVWMGMLGEHPDHIPMLLAKWYGDVYERHQQTGKWQFFCCNSLDVFKGTHAVIQAKRMPCKWSGYRLEYGDGRAFKLNERAMDLAMEALDRFGIDYRA